MNATKRIARLGRVAIMVVALLGVGLHASAQNEDAGKARSFLPFNDFLATTRTAGSSDYLGQSTSMVRGTQAFEQMREHILNLYEGVAVSHSFVLDGDHFDCVPEMQQPGVRLRGVKSIASPPPASVFPKATNLSVSDSELGQKPITIPSQLSPDKLVDEFGNSRVCEDGTIPMRRVTLEETSRFGTLKNYFEKGPDGAGQARLPGKVVPPSAVAHKYSYTYQYVNNLGDTTTLNQWSPYVNTQLGEIFSLSQSWTIAYTPLLQTAEVGWQNYPAFYGGENSRLFIYWTADGYNHTGCYNLSCGAFVQYSGGNGWYLGAGFSNYSSWGGAQYEFRAMYYFYQGNWWLGLGNVNGISWVGYYPGSLYHGGAMTTNSQLLEFGSESVGSNPWPPEGSGGWSGYGYRYAAYQRELWYYANPSYAADWDSLTAAQPSSNCYTISGPYWGGWNPPSNDWGVYFYEGGPGGYNCY